jgi:hypothetical protein
LCHGLLLTVSRCLSSSFSRLPFACHRMLTCSDEQYLPAIDRLRISIQDIKSIEALLKLSSSNQVLRQLQAHFVKLLEHADAAEADWQQLQATANHSHILASSFLQVISGVPAGVLVQLTPMQQQALYNALATLMHCGLQQHLAPFISSCSSPMLVTAMVAQLDSFFTVLHEGERCGDELLNAVQQALGHVLWLLAYGPEGAGNYQRLCMQLLTATSPADLRSKAQDVHRESSQMMQEQQQQEEVAAAAANGAGCSQGSASAADASAAATAAASAEEMADAAPETDAPGMYGPAAALPLAVGQTRPGLAAAARPAAACLLQQRMQVATPAATLSNKTRCSAAAQYSTAAATQPLRQPSTSADSATVACHSSPTAAAPPGSRCSSSHCMEVLPPGLLQAVPLPVQALLCLAAAALPQLQLLVMWSNPTHMAAAV